MTCNPVGAIPSPARDAFVANDRHDYDYVGRAAVDLRVDRVHDIVSKSMTFSVDKGIVEIKLCRFNIILAKSRF